MKNVKTKITPFIEYMGEATAACLVTMVQGNILALTIHHLFIASQTGIIAGGIAAIGLLATKTRNRWIISVVLGVITGFVDFYVHPGMIGSAAIEAIVTGLGAAIISFGIGTAIRKLSASKGL
jgi:hypothetical protein